MAELTLEQQRALALSRARQRARASEGGTRPYGGARPEFERMAAGMTPQQTDEARWTVQTLYGDYLREQAMRPREGEAPQDRERRLYGSMGGMESPTARTTSDGRGYVYDAADRPGAVEGVARDAYQGYTAGGGDEVVARGAATVDAMRGRGDTYDVRLDSERRKRGEFREDSPVLSYGAEVAGALPLALAMPGSSGGSLAQRSAVGGLEAAIGGTGYGFNASEGGFANRLKDGAMTGAIAAPIGLAIAPAGAAITGNLASRLMTNNAARSVGMPRAAYDVIIRAADADGSLYGPGAQRIQAAGRDAMLADAGPNTLGLLDTAVQKSGPAATTARAAIDDRVDNASAAVTGALDDALGKPGVSSSRSLIVYGDKTNPLDLIYKRAYAKPIDYASDAGRNIEQLVTTRVPGSAIKAANELMRVEGKASQQILADIADDGTVTFREMPDVRQIDYITRGLREVADQADGKGKMGGTTQTGRAYANLSREIRNSLKEAVPEYKAALNTAAGMIREGNAKDFGGIVLSARTTRDDVVEMMSDMGDAERRKVAEGLRMQIDDALANVKRAMTDSNMEAREAVKALRELSSRAAREKVETIIGPEASRRLFADLDQAATAFDLRAGVAANSKTFARTSMDESIKAQTDDGVVNAFRSGEPIGAARRLAQTLMGRTPAAKERVADETYSAIVQALTGPRGYQALQNLQRMHDAQMGIPQAAGQVGRLTERLLKGGGVPAAAAGYQPYR